MKAKALMLGTAAALVMSANAQAADLPAAAPAEYVKVCDAFGSGFFYIPGSDTCLKISGFVRNDYFMHESGWGNARPLFANSIVKGATNNDTVSMRIRGQLNFDARTQTDYGPVRAFIRFRTEKRSDGGGGNMYPYYSFVQFAGITAGYAQSFFDFFPVGGIMSNYLHSDIVTPLLAYTYTAPGGFYATLSLEDNNFSSGDSLASGLNVVSLDGDGESNWGHSRQDAPALVGAIGVSQSWGKAQLSGVVGQAEFTEGEASEQEIFWAVKGGLTVNADIGGAKATQFGITAAYGQNGGKYVSTGGPATAYIDGTSGVDSVENVDSWSVSAGFRHWWAPNLRSTVMGHYAAFDFGDAYTVANGTTDSLTFATANLIWSPVSKMDIGLELIYGNKETTAAGVGATSKSEDAFAGMFRIQRNF